MNLRDVWNLIWMTIAVFMVATLALVVRWWIGSGLGWW